MMRMVPPISKWLVRRLKGVDALYWEERAGERFHFILPACRSSSSSAAGRTKRRPASYSKVGSGPRCRDPRLRRPRRAPGTSHWPARAAAGPTPPPPSTTTATTSPVVHAIATGGHVGHGGSLLDGRALPSGREPRGPRRSRPGSRKQRKLSWGRCADERH
jgi:hypothetical protein